MAKRELQAWLETGKYLPKSLRDFQTQKEVFKAMHELVSDNEGTRRVSWIDGQIYVIDVFLWFMARRGWTLQRSQANVDFLDLDQTVNDANTRRNAVFAKMLSGEKK